MKRAFIGHFHVAAVLALALAVCPAQSNELDDIQWAKEMKSIGDPMRVIDTNPQTFTITDGTASVRVIDGDTIAPSRGAPVRIVDYDAPETRKHPRYGYKCEAERLLGLKAKKRLFQLLSPPRVLDIDWVKGRNGAQVDVFGRRLAYVYSNRKLVGDVLISEGLAKAWKPGKPKPRFCP